MRRRVYQILEKGGRTDHDPVARAINTGFVVLIVLNVFLAIVSTVESIESQYGSVLYALEMFSVAVFSAEYLLRLWACTVDPRYQEPVWGRIRFALKPLALIDLVTVLPFYLPMIALDLRFARVFRLARILRLLKLGRYSDTVQTMGFVLRAKREDLVLTVFTTSLLLVFVSSIMYLIENNAQPEAFPSIPATLWWGVATLTTVGYGDVYPITVMGKLFGGLTAVLGVGLFALPAGILASGFNEAMERKRRPLVCPHCGKPMKE